MLRACSKTDVDAVIIATPTERHHADLMMVQVSQDGIG